MQPSEEELEQQRQEQIARQKIQRTNYSIEIASKRAVAQKRNEQQVPDQLPAGVFSTDTTVDYLQNTYNYGAFVFSGEGT